MAAGIGTLLDDDYTQKCCKTIIENREYTANELKKLGFTMKPSSANFVFAKHESVSGEKIYTELKARGILVRHFTKSEICQYNRITIGTKEQMQSLLSALEEIL